MTHLYRNVRIDAALDRIDEDSVVTCTCLERYVIVVDLHVELRL